MIRIEKLREAIKKEKEIRIKLQTNYIKSKLEKIKNDVEILKKIQSE